MLLTSTQSANDPITENVRYAIAQLDARILMKGITQAEANLFYAY